MRRITVIAGHYGSGKTELAVSLALRLAEEKDTPFERVSVVLEKAVYLSIILCIIVSCGLLTADYAVFSPRP